MRFVRIFRAIPGILAGALAAPMALCAPDMLVASENARGDVILTLAGSRDCVGDYTATLAGSSAFNEPAITIASNYQKPDCEPSAVPVAFSATASVGYRQPGTHAVTWTLRRVNASGITATETFVGTFSVPTGRLVRGVTATPEAITFPPQEVGTRSAAVTVTVTNPDPVPHGLIVERRPVVTCLPAFGPICIPPLGGAGDFNIATDCAQSLAPLASCTIDVSFTPNARGPRYGALSIYPQGNLRSAVVSLKGGPPFGPLLPAVSARGRVGTDYVISGFVIEGGPKKVLVRARGPSLISLGIIEALADPEVDLYDSGGRRVAARDWRTDLETAALLRTLGLQPQEVGEPAVVATLDSGTYTVVGRSASNGAGVTVIDILEMNEPDHPITATSVRAWVTPGEGAAIAGFVVDGDEPRAMVVRARGASLAGFPGITPLQDPALAVVSASDNHLIASNDNWATANVLNQLGRSGYAPSNDHEAAVLLFLSPGVYTAVVSGNGKGAGTAILEVFAVPCCMSSTLP